MLSHTSVHPLTQNQRLLRLNLWYALIATLVLASVIAVHYQLFISSESARRSDSELLNLEVGKTAIATEISNIQSDVNFLARQAELHRYFDHLDRETLEIMARDFALFANEKIIYDQIRMIDRAGQEIIRINNQDGQSVIVEQEQLQKKANRYYFTETLQLERNEIYISPFDLNIEHGKIQIPIKPVIRFGTPVFDSTGNKIGVLILNYLGNRLLNNFRAATANIADHIMILNHEGYWLSHYNRDLEWGFMLDHDYTFASDFEQEWQSISTTESGQFATDNGFFSYTTVYPGLEISGIGKDLNSVQTRPEYFNRPWNLVSHITIDELNLLPATFFKDNLFVYLLLFVIFLLATHIIARLQTHRQIAEIEVEFEQHFRRVLESIELKVLAIDMNGSITFCNDALLSLLGWQRDQLIGQNWLEKLVASHCRTECAGLFDKTVRQEVEPTMHESWMQDRSGNEYLIRWHDSFLKDAAGEPLGLIFMGEDITRERENEIRIRHLSEAVEQSPVSVVLTNDSGMIEYVNPKFEDVSGYSLDEIKGLNPSILKSGETSSKDYSALWSTIRKGGTWRGIFHNRKKNGEFYWESASISGVRNPEGEMTHYLAVKEDITEQKLLEERFQHCFNSAPVAMVMSDGKGRILMANDHLLRLFGYRSDELMGQEIQQIIPPEAYDKRFVKATVDSESDDEDLSAGVGDFLAETKSGDTFPVEIGFSSAPSLEGKLIISAVIDLTARIQLENTLLQRNEEISRNQALNKVGRMANMIAHDLRNPLSSIKMGLQITQKQPPNMTVENAIEINQIALDQVQYMEEILADLMSYSRPDALNLEWVDVTKVIENSISLVQKEIESSNATINTWYEKGLPLVSVDVRKLRQVVTNLLSNAIQAAESLDDTAPVVNISVHLNLSEDGPGIKIIVEDNGCGIDTESVEELFEPFYTKRAKGTGLGLAIARRFIELQRGHLQLEAGEKAGCAAIVRLKIDPAQ